MKISISGFLTGKPRGRKYPETGVGIRVFTFLTFVAWLSMDRGVYPVMRKCSFGVGMRGEMILSKSLFMYPGYRSVAVHADITKTCVTNRRWKMEGVFFQIF